MHNWIDPMYIYICTYTTYTYVQHCIAQSGIETLNRGSKHAWTSSSSFSMYVYASYTPLNQTPHPKAASGFAGVRTGSSSWRAYCFWGNEEVYIGSFPSALEAARARHQWMASNVQGYAAQSRARPIRPVVPQAQGGHVQMAAPRPPAPSPMLSMMDECEVFMAEDEISAAEQAVKVRARVSVRVGVKDEISPAKEAVKAPQPVAIMLLHA